MLSILVKNGRIWTGQSFSRGDVLIREGKIASVGNVEDTADVIFDASGRIVTPGLVDIHTHMRHLTSDFYGTPIEPVCFANGVTAAVEASANDSGNEKLLDHCMVDGLVFVGVPIRNNQPDFSKTDELLARFGKYAIGLKVCFDNSNGQVWDTKPLREICAFAHQRGRKVMVHSSGSPVPMKMLLEELSAGDICTHAFHGGKNSALEDSFTSLKAAQRRGIVIDGGFAGTVHLDTEVLRAALQSGLIPDTISTDITKLSAFVRGGNYGLNLCMTMARALGMSEEEILRAVTSRAAKAVNCEEHWGALFPGRKGDLAVLEYSTCPYILRNASGSILSGQEGYRCLLTIAEGQVVYRSAGI